MSMFRSSTNKGIALIDGLTFRNKQVEYSIVDDLAIFEGDIILGKAEDVKRDTENKKLQKNMQFGIGITGTRFLWPDNVIPYTIDDSLPMKYRVSEAIAYLDSLNLGFKFIPRTNEKDFVTFIKGGGCSSFVGRQGGQQYVMLANACNRGSVIHEIGHVIGLWHEQSREDRDSWVTIVWENIIPGFEHNFTQHITDGDDIGSYDYKSILHYPDWAFTKNGRSTIIPKVPGATIGLQQVLSPGDISAFKTRLSPIVTPPDPIDPTGLTKQEIMEHQINLNKLGWGMPIDGIYGPKTKEATALFQVALTWPYLNGTKPLDVTGLPDTNTRYALALTVLNNGKISPNFSLSEFKNSEEKWVKVSWLLVFFLEYTRQFKGNKPLRIEYGYGMSGRHNFGDAADIPIEYGLIWHEAKKLGFSGIGIFDDGSGRVKHLDTRYGLFAPQIDIWFYDPVTLKTYNVNKKPLPSP